jgi:hypothetical protein
MRSGASPTGGMADRVQGERIGPSEIRIGDVLVSSTDRRGLPRRFTVLEIARPYALVWVIGVHEAASAFPGLTGRFHVHADEFVARIPADSPADAAIDSMIVHRRAAPL